MASGKMHDRSIYLFSPIVGMATAAYLGVTPGIVAASAHLLGGLYLSPDLDLKSLPWRRWGVLRFLWMPYQRIPHRHWLSHAPLVGTVGRLAYLLLLMSPIVGLIGMGSFRLTSDLIQLAVVAIAAVEISAINHLFLDGMIIPLPMFVKNWLRS